MSTALVPIDYQPRSAQACRVHTITDRFSLANTYIINDGEIVVIDPASPQQVQAVISYIRYFLRRDEADIGLIVLTHFHSDQVAGAFALQARTGARIAASSAARSAPSLCLQQQALAETGFLPARLRLARLCRSFIRQALVAGTRRVVRRLLPESLQQLELFPRQYKALCARIDYWLLDEEGLPGHPYWKVLAAPGHMPESLCLYNALSGELLCGETLITAHRSAARARSMRDARALHLALARLRRLPVRFLFPGHGRPLLAASALAHLV